jgi:predicted site-specific integrase-resolvase
MGLFILKIPVIVLEMGVITGICVYYFCYYDDIYSMAKNRIKLSKFAKEQGMAYITVYKHWQAGNIEGIQLPSGTILVSGWVEQDVAKDDKELAIIYSRVSTNTQKLKMKNQTTALTNFAHERGYEIIDTIEEVGVGFSDHRTKLLSVLHRTDWDVLIVEDIDNFTKFGYPYIEVLLRRHGQQVVARNETEEQPNTSEHIIDSSGEQELISLLTRTKTLMKGLLGVGGAKAQIEKSITALLS